MIYLDTSCLLKLLREEAESDAVRHAVEAESEVVVSSLAELETEVQLKAAAVGGEIRTTIPFPPSAGGGVLDGAAATPPSAGDSLPFARPAASRSDGRVEAEAAHDVG